MERKRERRRGESPEISRFHVRNSELSLTVLAGNSSCASDLSSSAFPQDINNEARLMEQIDWLNKPRKPNKECVEGRRGEN